MATRSDEPTPDDTAERAARVECTRADGDAVLKVDGPLGAHSGRDLVMACARALTESPTSLRLDLREVTACSEEGVAAVSRCLTSGRTLDGGVHVAVRSDAGRRALLASIAEM